MLTTHDTMTNDLNHSEFAAFGPTDSASLDRLLAGGSVADLVDANQPERAERVSRLLSLLEQWEAADSEPGLAQRTFSTVLNANPVSLSAEDVEALDAYLDLHRQGLTDGPMPSGLRERVANLQGVLNVLDRANGEPVPEGLADRTMLAIDHDRQQQQQRSALSVMTIASDRQSSIGIRQIATTAALFILGLSILLPMLNNAQRNAQIAQCSENLAGLGADLQQIAFDYKGQTHRPNQPEAGVFNPLAKFARTNLDGSTVPANQANFFVLMDERRVASQHLACPTGLRNDPAALYNGQNPAAGGPFRIFLEARPIFADTNPLYTVTDKGLVRDQAVSALTRSVNHAGRGQNALISDGSVRWMVRPAIAGNADTSDNIWLYQPTKNNDRNDDVFLTP